ncbi:MAG: SMI1/KNR4 family protein [Planctomycetes bacterium]|nr:SMI1/KNR4 family protein [Planctomycetota bacterium]
MKELPKPFRYIGSDGWADACRRFLVAHGEPSPVPVSEEDLREAERRIGVSFPPQYATLLRELGAATIAQMRFVGCEELGKIDSAHWCAATLGPLHDEVICVVDYLDGTGYRVLMDCSTGRCGRYVEMSDRLPQLKHSFTDVLYLALHQMAVEYWNDPELDWLLDELDDGWGHECC